MIRTAINLFDVQESRKHRNSEKYESLILRDVQRGPSAIIGVIKVEEPRHNLKHALGTHCEVALSNRSHKL